MGFAEDIRELSRRLIEMDKNSITTEEATKVSMVMPFLIVLGYDVFNHKEVIPEFTAD